MRHLVVISLLFISSGLFSQDRVIRSGFTGVELIRVHNPAAGDFLFSLQALRDYINSQGGGATNHSELTLDDGTNPHGTTKSDVGLGNVDNTSDLDKPIGTATQTALDNKQAILSEGSFVDGDKSKLDGVENSATADQTGSEIVSAIDTELGNTDWQDGSPWSENGTDIYYDSGNVGIGLSDPDEDLEVNGNIKLSSSLPYIRFNGNNTASTFDIKHNNSSRLEFYYNNNRLSYYTPIGTSGQFAFKQYSTGATADNFPGFSFDGDQNTGMGLYGADQLFLSTGGSTRLLATNTDIKLNDYPNTRNDLVSPVNFLSTDASGNILSLPIDSIPSGGSSLWSENGTEIYYNTSNVGIGTTDPVSDLHIQGTDELSRYVSNNDNGRIDYYLGGTRQSRYGWNATESSFKSYPTAADMLFATASSGDIKFRTGGVDNTAFDRMIITGSGNVGIGTTTPSEELDVQGNTVLGGDVTFEGAIITHTSTSAAGNYTILLTDHTIWKTGITGGIGGGDTVTLPSGAANGQEFLIVDASGTAGSNFISLATAGSELINGSATMSGAIRENYGYVKVKFDGTNYFVINK